MEKPLEIRWHGRGGQGVVTASRILADALLREGKYFQAFPEYGPERMGAPVKAYNRVSSTPIRIHSGVTSPEMVVVVDPTLLGAVDVLEGLAENGTVVANFPGTPGDLRNLLHFASGTVVVVDASRISREILGRVVVNTPILGALCRVLPEVKLENVLEAVKAQFGEKLRAEIVEKNLACLRRAYEEAQIG
ncbi:2-oxoacid:acceptor oxidoreductase family protein [Candidatus Caldatribacterium saccharofermentans]|uniref:2-oxoacid:acceptor oxidoreductase family protein n=1 Tax=Candidatus Caldatribacterium saccharofermentans TaxID=1454753 RepID=UPI003D01A100